MDIDNIIEEYREILLLMKKIARGYGMKNMVINFDNGKDSVMVRQRLDFLSSVGMVETIEKKEGVDNKFFINVAPQALIYYTHHYYEIEEFIKSKVPPMGKIDIITRIFTLEKGPHCENCCDVEGGGSSGLVGGGGDEY